MSAITTASVIAGIGAAGSLASGAASFLSSAPKASGQAATATVGSSANNAAAARSLLLETAGGSAGSPLAPGEVGGNNKTIFGN